MPSIASMHALTGCDTAYFPFNKGKVSFLGILEAGYFPGLFHVIRDQDAMQWDPLEVGLSFLCALYGLKPGTPMEEPRYNLYRKTKARPRLSNLPPNSINLLLHVQRAHLQMMLWKAISNFGWQINDVVLSECIDPGPTWPPALMEVISCRCRAAWKACAAFCSYRKECLSCTIYCLCQSGDECCNPHERSQHVDDEDEKNGEPQVYEALDADCSAY